MKEVELDSDLKQVQDLPMGRAVWFWWGRDLTGEVASPPEQAEVWFEDAPVASSLTKTLSLLGCFAVAKERLVSTALLGLPVIMLSKCLIGN